MHHAFSYAFRFCLLGAAVYGCTRLVLGEYRYAKGMTATSVQSSLDYLTDAAEIYPWDFRFRAAQAKQLHLLAQRVPEVTPLAAESLRLALSVDPNAADLVSRLYGAQRALGRCEEAAETGKRLIALVPRSDIAKEIVALPCGGTDGR